MDKTRIPDIKVIEKGLRDKDPNIRGQAHRAGQKIKSEMHDKRITRMRERVVHETRRGRNDNANDVREDIQNHTRGGFGRSSFSFSIPEGIFK